MGEGGIHLARSWCLVGTCAGGQGRSSDRRCLWFPCTRSKTEAQLLFLRDWWLYEKNDERLHHAKTFCIYFGNEKTVDIDRVVRQAAIVFASTADRQECRHTRAALKQNSKTPNHEHTLGSQHCAQQVQRHRTWRNNSSDGGRPSRVIREWIS